MIELSDKVWVYGMWFVQGDELDWMACVRKVEGKWQLDSRFRYYSDDKVFDSQDRKSWFKAVAKDENATVETLADGVHKVAARVCEQLKSKVDFLLLECQGDDPKIMFHMGLRDNLHMRRPTEEESRELGKAR